MKCLQCGGELEHFVLDESDDSICLRCKHANSVSSTEGNEPTRKTTYKLLPFVKEREAQAVETSLWENHKKEDVSIACYIVCSPFPPHKLSKDKKFSIGREVLNHLVLPSIDVSRFHAVIKWDSEAYVISDLGSSNGTFVNQNPIDFHVLKNEDKILIGNNILTYQEVTIGGAPIVGANQETQQIGASKKWMERNREVLQEKSEVHGTIRGDIEVMSLTSILQVLGVDEKSGCLKIDDGNTEASIYFVAGEVVHSVCQNLKGKQAFFAIMRWKKGKFEFKGNEGPAEVTMSKKVEWLLFETARIMDEESRQ